MPEYSSIPTDSYRSLPASAYQPIEIAVKQVINGWSVICPDSGLVLAVVASESRAQSIAKEHREVA